MATAIQTQHEYIDTALLTKEQRTALESFWKGGFHKKASLTHHLLYAMLRGKDWRKTATPPTNTVKVENGALTGWCFWNAYRTVKYSGWVVVNNHSLKRIDRFINDFDGTVTPEMLASLHSRLPTIGKEHVTLIEANKIMPWWEGYHVNWTCPAYLDAHGE